MYLVVIVATRLNGLRSLAELSAFDLVMTISIGSIVSTTALSPSVSLADGIAAVAVLFLGQSSISILRRRSRMQHLVDNQPVVLMVGSVVLDDHLAEARMTRGDLFGKLRERGVRDLADVAVVVLERTGGVSVIERGPEDGVAVGPELLTDVRGAEQVPVRRP